MKRKTPCWEREGTKRNLLMPFALSNEVVFRTRVAASITDHLIKRFCTKFGDV